MAAVLKEKLPSKGMTYPEAVTPEIDLNLLLNIATVTDRYSKDAIGLLVSVSEVFEISAYRTGAKNYFNHALRALQDEGFITRTPFTLALTPAGFNYIHGIQ